jgi:ABC-2 type transport system permease protein
MLVPTSMLPGAARALSYVLAPTWGVKAVNASALGASGAFTAVLYCLALSVGYSLLTALLLRRFEWLARAKGTLSLR